MIREFYKNDEHSRQLPGKKDTVCISKKGHIQKRLILIKYSISLINAKFDLKKLVIYNCTFHTKATSWTRSSDIEQNDLEQLFLSFFVIHYSWMQRAVQLSWFQ
jgi:hypothetical protein